MEKTLPPIPAKRYFTIGEVGELCGVKPHVLRYWEQEFTQLRPMKRRGNRRYYQHHEVLMIRRIRDLLYDQGFTISGARNKLQDLVQRGWKVSHTDSVQTIGDHDGVVQTVTPAIDPPLSLTASHLNRIPTSSLGLVQDVRRELLAIRELLGDAVWVDGPGPL
jgi:DNA-binding transcriptional MerR regulator